MLTVLFCNFIIEMKNVEIDGFAFELFIPSSQIASKIKDLAKQLSHAYPDDFPMCLVILNGASVFAKNLLRYLDPFVEVHMITVKSYSGMKSNSINFNDLSVGLVKDKKILLIEDIVDTGKTLSFLRNMLMKNGAQQVHCVTLLFKGAYPIITISFSLTTSISPPISALKSFEANILRIVFVLVIIPCIF